MKKTVLFAKNAVNVFFHITTRCNLKCAHCYINPDQHGDHTLPLHTVTDWLGLFYNPGKDANLILLGGEPTLHPELAKIVEAARQIGYGSVTIDTNGYLFHDILDKITPSRVDYFSFSLDGATSATNDRIRGAGCYDTCIRGIRQAAEKGFSVSVIYTVSRQNMHELADMKPILEDLGVSRFFIQVIGIRGRSAGFDKEALQLSPQEWETHVPPVAEAVARSGITVTYPQVFLAPEETFECAGNVAENYFLFPNGRVYQCPLCEDYPLHSMRIENNRICRTPKINEADLFSLDIPEGCVMNKLVQAGNIDYDSGGKPVCKIACCLLKEEIPASL
ncbi:MAG: radical SAM protein [Desulfobacterales bacterium]|nr:radical SAM protein [Desulfobacterales bacterium]MBS3754282.1 radical SAM protein [Desulfobacterales bacterium]